MFQKENIFRLKEQLDAAVKEGAQLYLEGEKASADEVAWACAVNEEAVYMPDYVLDKEGKLSELRYDKIRLM